MSVPVKRPSTSVSSSGSAGSANFGARFVEKGRWAANLKGTKPLAEPTTVPEIFTKVIIHGCRKVLFLDPKLRLTAYAVLLFFISLVSDYLPFPKTYFSSSGNIPNSYFVKFSWGWTFVSTGIFMYLTSAVYCCGERKHIMRHMGRLLLGTIIWFIWTNLFRIIEETTGQCIVKDGSTLYSIRSRKSCLTKAGKWTSFDISGHAFLLVWCTLFTIEEAKSIIGWDGIKDLLRNEEHYRGRISQTGSSGDLPDETPLNNLTEEQFEQLKVNYTQFDIFAKVILIFMTVLTVLWDGMLIATAVYFHVMIEKVIGGLVAAIMWFVLYRGFYNLKTSPGLPGVGLFRYNFESRQAVIPKAASLSSSTRSKTKPTGTGISSRTRAKDSEDLPKFLGMPLYALRSTRKDNLDHLNSLET